MKKYFLFTIVFLVWLMCVPASAQDSESEVITSGDYEYILLEDGTAEIHNYWGKETDFMILDTLDGYTVTSIGTGSFLSRKYPAVIISHPRSEGLRKSQNFGRHAVFGRI